MTMIHYKDFPGWNYFLSFLLVILFNCTEHVKAQENFVDFPFIHELPSFHTILLGSNELCLSEGVEPIFSYTIRQGNERRIQMFPPFIAVPESVNSILSFRVNASAVSDAADLSESGVVIEVPKLKSIVVKGFVPRVQIDANISDLTLLDDQSRDSYIKANFGLESSSDPVNITLKLSGENSKIEIAATTNNTSFVFGEGSESENEAVSIRGLVMGGTIGGIGSSFLVQNPDKFEESTGLWTKDAVTNVTCLNQNSLWSLNGGRCNENNIEFVDAGDSVCKITIEEVTTEPPFDPSYDCRYVCEKDASYSLAGECNADNSASMRVQSGMVLLIALFLTILIL